MIAFWVLAVVLVATAVFTIVQKSPVYSVVGLLANFIALAITYLTLNAEFVFVMQIIVYTGAVLVLFVFVIALLSSGVGPFAEGPNRLPRALWPALALIVIGIALFAIGFRGPLASLPQHQPTSQIGQAGDPAVFGSVADFGAALFSTHLLPFEITAFILMVSVVGVVVLAGDAALVKTRGRHHPGRRPRERESIVKAQR